MHSDWEISDRELSQSQMLLFGTSLYNLGTNKIWYVDERHLTWEWMTFDGWTGDIWHIDEWCFVGGWVMFAELTNVVCHVDEWHFVGGWMMFDV